MKTTLRKMISTIADYADNNIIPHFDSTGSTKAMAKIATLTARMSPKFAIKVASKYHQLLNAFFSAMGADDVDREIDVDERVFQEFVGTEGYEMKVRDGDKVVSFHFKMEDINKLINILRNK